MEKDLDVLRVAAQRALGRMKDLERPIEELPLSDLEVKRALQLHSMVPIAIDIHGGYGSEEKALEAIRELGRLSWEIEFRYREIDELE